MGKKRGHGCAPSLGDTHADQKLFEATTEQSADKRLALAVSGQSHLRACSYALHTAHNLSGLNLNTEMAPKKTVLN